MAFGKIGLDRQTFWAMTPREFFNAWIGYSEQQNRRLEAMRNVAYGAARFNASSSAFSKEQSRAIARHRFPWEAPPRKAQGGEASVKAFIESWKNRASNGRS